MSMTGRIVLVTGSTDGIGKLTATRLASLGAAVLIHGRNPEKVGQVIEQIKVETSAKNIDGFIADFSSLEQVRRMSDEIHRKFNRLDVLVNNAAYLEKAFQVNEEGHEMTFAVNVLAPFLLTSLLLDLIKASPAGRIIQVAGSYARSAVQKIDFDDLQLKKNYNFHHSYAIAKMCGIMFMYRLADMHKKEQFTVNCVDPGLVATKMLGRSWVPVDQGIPVEEADDAFKLASEDRYGGITGKYFVNGEEAETSPYTYDVEVQKKLWQVLTDMTKSKSGAESHKGAQ